jgi:outer membrane protein assembly factor BamB
MLPLLRVWIWTAATLALVVAAALLWRGSDAAATESTTAAPAGVPSGTPAGAVSRAWERDGDPLPGDVVEQGRVILGNAHGVAAVDPLSGDEAWHYTRSNARLCGVTATNGVVVAVFRTEDRCDEAVALDAGTGVRTWTRNVRFRGDATLKSTDQIVLAVSETGVVTLDPTGDNIRWRYDPPEGCLIDDAEVGSAGVAVLQTCDGSDTAQLRLLDGFTGKGHWNHDVAVPEDGEVRLLGADQLLGLVVGDQVQSLAGDDGSVRHRIPLTGDDEPQQLSFDGVALLWVDGTLHALDAPSGAQLWQSAARGLSSAPVADKAAAGAGALVVPDGNGFSRRDPRSGQVLGRSSVADLPASGTASGVGPVVVYRLPDRVLAYS